MNCGLCGGKLGMFANNTIEGVDVCGDCREQFNIIMGATSEKMVDYFSRSQIEAAEKRMSAYRGG